MSTSIWLLAAGIIGAAVLQNSLRRVVLSPIGFLIYVVEQAWRAVDGWKQALRAASWRRLAELGLDGPRFSATFLVGPLFSSACFAAFSSTEMLLVVLSMQPLLGIEGVMLPGWLGHIELALTGAVLLSGVYTAWAAAGLRADAEGAHLIVVRWHPLGSRRVLRRLSLLAFGLAAVTVVGLAALRAHELMRAEVEMGGEEYNAEFQGAADAGGALGTDEAVATAPDLVTTTIRYAVLLASGLGLLLSSAVAWAVGGADLLRLAPVLLTWILLVIAGSVGTVIGAAWTVLRGLRAFVVYALDALLAVATLCARVPVEAVRALHDWASDCVAAGGVTRALKGTLAVLTSVAVDVQMPRRASP